MDFFLDFLDSFEFLRFWDILNIFLDFFGFFFGLCGFKIKLLRLLLKVTKVTTEHQRRPKIGQNSTMIFFGARRTKKDLGQRPKPSAGARSRPA